MLRGPKRRLTSIVRGTLDLSRLRFGRRLRRLFSLRGFSELPGFLGFGGVLGGFGSFGCVRGLGGGSGGLERDASTSGQRLALPLQRCQPPSLRQGYACWCELQHYGNLVRIDFPRVDMQSCTCALASRICFVQRR